jgi:hypothetical protein
VVNALAIFWIAVTLVTIVSLTVVITPHYTQVFAQGNNSAGIVEDSGNITITTNATLADECEENMTSDECDTGSISRIVKFR